MRIINDENLTLIQSTFWMECEVEICIRLTSLEIALGKPAYVTAIDPEIDSAFNNDLDTPKVILRLREIEKSDVGNKREIFMYADQVLGLDLNRPIFARELTDQMQELLEERTKDRSEKRWADSDALRVQLENLGLQIHDTADGQNWS